MKKVVFKRAAIIAIAAVTMSLAVNAQQQGDKAVGGNLVIGTGNSFTHVGIGAKFFYNVTDPIRLAGEFDFFLPKYETTWWDLSVYGHYLFPVADKVVVYPSVGLGIVGAKVKGFDGNNDFALSLGGGADYALTDQLSLTGELRLKLINGTNRLNIALGVVYKF